MFVMELCFIWPNRMKIRTDESSLSSLHKFTLLGVIGSARCLISGIYPINNLVLRCKYIPLYLSMSGDIESKSVELI